MLMLLLDHDVRQLIVGGGLLRVCRPAQGIWSDRYYCGCAEQPCSQINVHDMFPPDGETRAETQPSAGIQISVARLE